MKNYFILLIRCAIILVKIKSICTVYKKLLCLLAYIITLFERRMILMTPRFTMLEKEREYLLSEYNKANKSDKVNLLIKIMDLEEQLDYEKNIRQRKTS
jgi:hypothetical protein